MNRSEFLAKHIKRWGVPLLLALALVPVGLSNNILFHSLVELFAVGIAVMTFVVAWNTFGFSKNVLLLYLGCGYFWIGVLDLAHALTYQGLGFIEGLRSDTTIQFWILARYLEALVLLGVPLVSRSQFSPSHTFSFFAFWTFLGFVAVHQNLIPVLLIDGQGLTATKVVAEYVVIAILLVSLSLMLRREAVPNRRIKSLILTSVTLTIIAEVCFTLYSGFEEFPFILGHFLKLFSFWAIYLALVNSSLMGPMRSLFQVAKSYEVMSDPTVIVDAEGIIKRANQSALREIGEQGIGSHCHELLHGLDTPRNQCPICQAITGQVAIQGFEFQRRPSGPWFEATLSGIFYTEENSAMVHSLRDISSRKNTEQQLINVNRLYSVLSHSNKAFARIHDRDALYQRICDIAVEYGDLKMAWIGIIEGAMVTPKFVSGDETGYLLEMQMRVDDSKWARGPVGKAAKSKLVACVNDVSTDPNFEPWRDAAISRGYASLAAVPIQLNEEVKGIFTLYSREPNVFDEQMLSLLESLQNDLSAALYNLDQLERKKSAEQTVRKLSTAIEQSTHAIFIVNSDGLIEYVNHEFTVLTGYSLKEVEGRHSRFLQSELAEPGSYDDMWSAIFKGDSWKGDVMQKRKDGTTYWAAQNISPIRDEKGEITHFVSASSDSTELREAQDTIKQLAFYDPLTGLPNRRLLMDRLEHDLHHAHRIGDSLAIMMCDLDNFKMVNDSLGHEYGDLLLKHVARAIQSRVRNEDTVARLGGDEFVAIIPGIKDETRVAALAEGILQELSKALLLSDTNVTVSTSIGITMAPQDGVEAGELLRNADMAMYHAKDAGKNRLQFYQPKMNEKVQTRLNLEHKLRAAVESQNFTLVYQPQIDIPTGKIIGFEALLRWIDMEEGIVLPSEFIPIAEETGLIEPIGDWVVQQAMTDWEKLIRAGYSGCTMAVNVSAYQFANSEHLQGVIKAAFENHTACQPDKFYVEITESTLIEDVEGTIEALNALKKLGIGISIDDFGTGYSSLNYLKRFPLDQLKIDQSFTRDLLEDTNDQAIICAIIAITESMDLKVVAEGVEGSKQAEALYQHGCFYAQGFYYYKPLPLHQLLNGDSLPVAN